ncbi:hypothetical protein [Actinorhabdospora filicis]|uniref:hypothetical protein n=1 Tax=Actinorhabdospora filicis TaxID=1785913 RepID=UPI002557AC8B|nr:hypothetical protein [Actinorhabdospora filicis]
MASSLAYSLGFYTDAADALADARRLLAAANTRWHEPVFDGTLYIGSHDAGEFLDLPAPVWLHVEVPGHLAEAARAVFAAPLGPPDRQGAVAFYEPLRPEHVAWLLTVPSLPVSVSPDRRPPGVVEEALLARAHLGRGDLTWHCDWAESRSGITGITLSVDSPGRHELFWHVRWRGDDLDPVAARYAALIGRTAAPPVAGW